MSANGQTQEKVSGRKWLREGEMAMSSQDDPQTSEGDNAKKKIAPQNSLSASKRRPKIGLALGAGVGRGWCHIGLIQALESNGLRPDIVAGTSIGAVVGGCYAAGALDALEDFARGLTRRRMVSLLDFSFSGGLFSGQRLREKLAASLGDIEYDALPIPFTAVATEIASGHEIWLRHGPLAQALAASYALPGLLEPVQIDGRWLFDGALVNPVPVSVCRAMGADVVIAVNLVSDAMFRGTIIGDRSIGDETMATLVNKIGGDTKSNWLDAFVSPRAFFKKYLQRAPNDPPSIASIMLDAFSITQDRIARSRLAGDPPDILINARLDQFGLFDFHRADELIAVGRETIARRLPDIRDHVGDAMTP